MKVFEKKCPNCGGNLDFKFGERDVTCGSCRRKYAVEYGVEDLSQLSEKAMEALESADITLRPARKMIVLVIAVFIGIAVLATIISIISMNNSRAEFERKKQETQLEFERQSQKMLDQVW